MAKQDKKESPDIKEGAYIEPGLVSITPRPDESYSQAVKIGREGAVAKVHVPENDQTSDEQKEAAKAKKTG